MRKRRFIKALVVIAALLAVAWLFPATIYVPLGFLRHEATFAGKPTSYWIRALNHEGFLGHAPPTGDIGKTLREGGSAAVPVLCELAENPDERLRAEALNALALIGPEAKAATPVLTATIKRDANSTRFLLASETLAKAEPAAAVEALSAVAGNKSDAGNRRAWALAELQKLAPEAQGALPVLNSMLHDQEEDVRLRVQAIAVLWRLKQPVEPLIAALCDTVSAEKSEAGVQALEVLAEMGPTARPALPVLMRLLEKPTLPITGRRWGPAHLHAIIRTVGKIGPEAGPAVPRLIAIFKSEKQAQLRKEVAQALSHIGQPAREALPVLLEAWRGGGAMAQEAAWWAGTMLLAAQPLSSVPRLGLGKNMKRTGVRVDAPTHEAIREAVLRIDADGAARAGIR